MIALATIGISFLTQEGAKLVGIDLAEQANIELVKRCLSQAFASARAFGVAAFLVAQVLLIMPAIEEIVFRWGLFSLVSRLASRVLRRGEGARREARDPSGDHQMIFALLSSLLFSAAHYITQPWPDNAFLALFFFGLAQCWLYRKTRRLWCAMLNHLLFNLTNLVLLFVV